jgi:hypothetical protein
MIEYSAQPQPLWTLGERLSWITGQVAPIEATGHNRFSKAALSIEDVEDALRPLFAEAGVVALWSCTGFETAPDKEAAWLCKFHVVIYASNNPLDKIEADWFDVGSSPMSAQSFAVKGFYRRLFHLASADDESVKASAARRTAQVREPVRDAPAASQAPEPSSDRPGAFSYAATGRENPTQLEEPPVDIIRLASTLKEPWHPKFLAQEFGRLKEETVRRRLVTAHLNECGPACEHVAVLAGMKEPDALPLS